MKTYNSIKALLATLVISALTATMIQAMSASLGEGRPVNPNPRRGSSSMPASSGEGRLVNPNPRRTSAPTVITAEEQVQMLRDELAQVKQELADTQERLAESQRKNFDSAPFRKKITAPEPEETATRNVWRKRVTAPEETAEVSATPEYQPSREVLQSIY